MSALRNLANKYMTNRLCDPISVHGDVNKSYVKENGLISDSYGHPPFSRGDRAPVTSSYSDSRSFSHNLKGTRSSIAALKKLCTVEGYSLAFQEQPSSPGGSVRQGDVSAQDSTCPSSLLKSYCSCTNRAAKEDSLLMRTSA